MGSITEYLSDSSSSSNSTQFFMCDTPGDLPTSGLTVGDLAYVKSSGELRIYNQNSIWLLCRDTTQIEADVLDLQRSFLLLLRNLVNVMGDDMAIDLQDKLEDSFNIEG